MTVSPTARLAEPRVGLGLQRPRRVGQHVAIGMANERTATTRHKDSLFEPGGTACCYWNGFQSNATTRLEDSHLGCGEQHAGLVELHDHREAILVPPPVWMTRMFMSRRRALTAAVGIFYKDCSCKLRLTQ